MKNYKISINANDQNKECSDMRNKIDKILGELVRKEINESQAVDKLFSLFNVSGMLPDQTKRHIDLAYLTGVFNVVGIDGLQKELTRLKEIGKKPHDIFTEGNYR